MIEVGEYVRTVDGKIAIFDRYSSRKETSIYKSPFNCFIKLQGRKTPLQCHRDFIVNHSFNIINLIEVGDYVNGYPVRRIPNFNNELCNFDLNTMEWIPLKDIDVYYNILTKELYQANCYTIKRKE